MLKFVRYTLATFSLLASVGCLALWWRSLTHWDMLLGPSHVVPSGVMSLYSCAGVGAIQLLARNTIGSSGSEWAYANTQPARGEYDRIAQHVKSKGQFDVYANEPIAYGVRFPLWYASLIFGLAGVGVLRIRRQFSIRSALVATTVVAALIGMAVRL